MKLFLLTLFITITFVQINAQCTSVETINDGFESYSTESLPPCWSSISAPHAMRVDDDDSKAHSGSQNLYTYTFFSFNDISYLITPELSTVDGTHFAEFYIKSTETNATFDIGTMSDNTDESTFVASSTANAITKDYQKITTANFPAISEHKYLAFRLVSPSWHTSIRIDDFKWFNSLDVVGITESQITDLVVFPNPTNGIVIIKTADGLLNTKLFNSVGIFVADLGNESTLDVSNFVDGIYFLKIKTIQTMQIVKLVIEK